MEKYKKGNYKNIKKEMYQNIKFNLHVFHFFFLNDLSDNYRIFCFAHFMLSSW